MTTRAVAYLRVSGVGQVDGDGFERQRDRIDAWARQHGIEVIEVYADEGVSGTLADRPALAQLLVDLEENHADVSLVVVESFDRLARELFIQEGILRDIWGLGREAVTAVGNVKASEDDDPTRTLIRQMLGAVAQYEKQMLVSKLRAARKRKRRQGERCEGRKPFGDRSGEDETLDRIRQLRRLPRGQKRRLSYAKIAATLNAEGRPSRSGKPWTGPTVRSIVVGHMPGLQG